MTAPGPMQHPRTWSGWAEGYAHHSTPAFAPHAIEALRRLPARLGDRALDVACGPGTLTLPCASRAASVLAVDFAAGMVRELRLRAGRAGVHNVHSAVMDAQALAIPDASFDVAYCLFGFMFFPDRARAFGEMRRVLRPGGRTLVATLGPIDRRPLMKVGFDALAAVFPALPRPSRGDLQEPAECVREMSAAGLQGVEAQVFTATTRFETAEAYLRMLVASGPSSAIRAALGEDAWEAAQGRLLAAIRERLPSEPADLAAESVLTVGTR